MHHLKFVLALCAAVAVGSGVVLGADVGTQPVPRSTDPSVVQGIISAIDLDKGSVTVVPPAPAPAGTMPTPAFSFFINAQTKIIKNGQIAVLKDLAIGDMCKAEIKYSFDGVPFALNVQASSPQAEPGLKFVTGVISAIDPATLRFELNGKPGPIGAVTVLKFFADKETKIIKNGHPAGFGDLKVGDMAGVGFVPGPTLQPSSIVRAAVIEVKNPVTPPQPGLKFVTGVISAVDPATLKFELTGKSGPDGTAPVLKFFADKETKIIKNGRPVGFGDLKVGDAARVGFVPGSTSSPGSVIRAAVIEAKSPVTPPPANTILEGLITGINLDKGSIRLESPTQAKPPVTFFVVDSTKIMRNGQPALLKDLKVGDACRAEVKPTPDGTLVALNVQTKSAATPPPGLKTVAGTISAIDYSKLTFELTVIRAPKAEATILRFYADKETKIRKNGNPAGFGDLKVGDMAGVGYVPAPTVGSGGPPQAGVRDAKTAPFPPHNVSFDGVITKIDLDKCSITLALPRETEPPVTFFVVDSTKILKNGQPALLKDLKIGETCRADVKSTPDGTLVALNVQVPLPPPPTTLAGVITAIDYSALKFTWWFKGNASIQPLGLTILADSNTKIRKNGNPAGFGDLKVGDLADFDPVSGTPIEPGSTIHAVVVEAKTPSANIILEGVIGAINLDKGSITLASPTQAEGARMFFVVDSTKIARNRHVALLKDLEIGEACRAEVKPTPDGSLVALKVQVPPTQGVTAGAGVILAIDYSARKLGWWYEGDGSLQPLGLTILADSNTKIRKNGNPAGFSDLKVGDLADFDPVSGTPIEPHGTVREIGIEAKTPSAPPPPGPR
ncbi:MAG: DUF5666 domain-containing protein [Chloroflexi bacterium]|nr:DUF5666 domain-containing protein [Chloroflexota bacterium]